jgi:Fe-S-cluster containining protein
MNKETSKYFQDYLSLRNEIDKLSGELADAHKKHMKCKKGCDMCCMDYSIFPIEFYFILNDLKGNKIEFSVGEKSKESVCVFLKNQVCSVYDQRPIICRTHGLPLLFMSEENQWELSACELNFTEFDFEDFSLDNTFEQDKYNSKLFMLNKEFIAGFQDKKYGETDLIPLKELLNHI